MLQELWSKVPNLKWIHSSSVGVDRLLWPALVDSPVVVSNARVSSIGMLREEKI